MPPEDEPEDEHGECAAEIHALTQKLELAQEREKLANAQIERLLAQREAVDLQLNEVTAHRDRLRDMLNDVRGMIFTDQSDGVVGRILHRIDPVEEEAEEVTEKPEDAPSPLCDVQVGCFGQCCKLLPCEDHPPKRLGVCDICAGSLKLPSGADCPMCTEPHHGH